jgi:ArsR family transcriptional regulator
MHASFDVAVEMLKALAEPTRFRLVLLVSAQDLTVSDLTAILGQSQPRISRHLKLLVEAGAVERHQEGSWAYFRLSDEPLAARLVQALRESVRDEDGALARDAERLAEVRRERAERAASYFARNGTASARCTCRTWTSRMLCSPHWDPPCVSPRISMWERARGGC